VNRLGEFSRRVKAERDCASRILRARSGGRMGSKGKRREVLGFRLGRTAGQSPRLILTEDWAIEAAWIDRPSGGSASGSQADIGEK